MKPVPDNATSTDVDALVPIIATTVAVPVTKPVLGGLKTIPTVLLEFAASVKGAPPGAGLKPFPETFTAEIVRFPVPLLETVMFCVLLPVTIQNQPVALGLGGVAERVKQNASRYLSVLQQAARTVKANDVPGQSADTNA